MAGNRNRRKQNSKVVKYRKPFQLNIGLLIFLVIFFYLLYYVYAYFTETDTSVYEVTEGTIAQNSMHTGLAIREEEVAYAQRSGYLTFYTKDATKAGVGSFVYSVDETGDFYNAMLAANNGELNLSPQSYRDLTRITDGFLENFKDASFYQVYQYKYLMENSLLEAISRRNLESGMVGEGDSSTYHLVRAGRDGVVVHRVDGYEGVTLDSFSADMFHQEVEREGYERREQISAGEPVFKTVTSEYWSVVFPIDALLASELEAKEGEYLQVEFQKDRSRASGQVRLLYREEGPYLALTFSNSMVRFATDRFVELELLDTGASGLKIPNTAIVSQDFFIVPRGFLGRGGNSNENGVYKKVVDAAGAESVEFVQVNILEEIDAGYVISGRELVDGDSIQKPESAESYLLMEKASLEGVYNINRGYAVFRRIEIVLQNEEYAIIRRGTPYGVTLFDRIALVAAGIVDDQIVHVQ